MKEQLESVVLQMYRAGVGCSEAVREFQKAFILTVLKVQKKEGISAKLPRDLEYTVTHYAIRSENCRLTSARHEYQRGVDLHDRRFQRRRCSDGRPSYIPVLSVRSAHFSECPG